MANTQYTFNGANPLEQEKTIAPGAVPPAAPAGVTMPTDDADTVTITSSGGTGTINGFIIDSAGGADTVSLNGSPILTDLTLGSGADILNIGTALLPGSINQSTFAGARGNDTFNIFTSAAGASESFFGGGAGADLFALQGNFDNVTVKGGGDGDRVLFTAAGGKFTNSVFKLGAGDDILVDQLFAVDVRGTTVEGGGGDDLIDFTASSVGSGVQGLSIGGGAGSDVIIGTKSGQNSVLGGRGDDFIVTFADSDRIGAGAGADTVFSGTGADSVFGGGEQDIIFGVAGQNTLSGGLGTDIIVGGGDEDEIYAVSENVEDNDASDDTLIGGSGNDTVDGSSGDNWIFGDGVDALAGLFLSGSGVDFTVNGIPAALKLNGFTASYNLGDGNTTNFTALARANASLVLNPALGNGITSSLEYWFELNPDLNPAAVIFTGTQTPTFDQLQQLADIDNLLVANTPGLNPANGFFQFVALGDDSLVGDSGDDVIFGGASGIFAYTKGVSSSNFAIDQDIIFGDNAAPDGNGGNDAIMGGLGADTMTGGIGNDLFLQGWGDSNTVATVSKGDNLTITFSGAGPDRVDIITDFTAADSIGTIIDQLSFRGWNGVLQNNLGSGTATLGAAGNVVIYSGDYDDVSGVFITTDNREGPDVLAFLADGISSGNAVNYGDQAVVLLGASDESFSLGNFV